MAHPTADQANPARETKEHSAATVLLRLLRLSPHKLSLAVGLSFAVLVSVLAIVAAHFIRSLLDAAIAGEVTAVLTSGLTLALVIALSALLEYGQRRLLGRFSEGTMAHLRNQCGRRLLRTSLAVLEGKHTTDHVSRMTNDMAGAQELIGENIPDLVQQSLAAVGALTYLCCLDWQLTLLVFVLMPVMLRVGQALGRPIHRLSRSLQERLSELTQVAQDFLSGVEVARIFGANQFIAEKYGQLVDESVKTARMLARKFAVLRAVSGAMAQLPYVVVFGIGGYRCIAGVMTPGSLVAFVDLLGNVAWPTSRFPALLGRVRRNAAAAARVSELLEVPQEREGGVTNRAVVEPEAVIECIDVEFSYPMHESRVLRNLSFTVSKGEVVALVGPTGCGKSTLLKLVLGFYDNFNGELKVNGRSVREWDLSSLRSQVSFVEQQPHLFPGTIRENLLYGNEHATEEEMVEAARAACIHDFVMSLPERYDTEIGELGSRLSTGQKQRIAIARALLKDASILLLDEATSALDAESERAVLESVKEALRGKTCVMVSHRLSGLRDVDRILVMDNGTIVETGSHYDLLASGGLYARLHNDQNRQGAPTGSEVSPEAEGRTVGRAADEPFES